MTEDEESLQDRDIKQEIIQRLDYHEMRVETRMERMEERVRQLEAQVRAQTDSGDSDLHRLRNLFARLVSRQKAEGNGQVSASRQERPFPITTRQTSIGVMLVAGIVTAIRDTSDRVDSGLLVARWFGVFLFCAGLPAIVAYAVAGRKEQWSRRNKWFFWVSTVTSLWALISAFQALG